MSVLNVNLTNPVFFACFNMGSTQKYKHSLNSSDNTLKPCYVLFLGLDNSLCGSYNQCLRYSFNEYESKT